MLCPACSDGRYDPADLSTGLEREGFGQAVVMLTVADAIVLGVISYEVSSPGGFRRSGSFDVSDSPSASMLVRLPEDDDYVVTMEAETKDGEWRCNGASEEFAVSGDDPVEVTVPLSCRRTSSNGNVRVNTDVNLCAELVELEVAPLVVELGGSLSLAATAIDEDEAPFALSYEWHVDSDFGSIEEPTAPTTTFTCDALGTPIVTIAVFDGECGMTAEIEVGCAPR